MGLISQTLIAAEIDIQASPSRTEGNIETLGCFLGTASCCSGERGTCCDRAVKSCSQPKAPILLVADWPAALGNILQALHDSVILAKALNRALLMPPVQGPRPSIDFHYLAEAFGIDILFVQVTEEVEALPIASEDERPSAEAVTIAWLPLRIGTSMTYSWLRAKCFSEVWRMQLGRLPRGVREGDTYLPRHSPDGDFSQEEILQLHLMAQKRARDGGRRVRIYGKVGPDGIGYLPGGGATAKSAPVLNHHGEHKGDSSGFSWLVAFSSSRPCASCW
eukprot:s1240_g7.t1